MHEIIALMLLAGVIGYCTALIRYIERHQ